MGKARRGRFAQTTGHFRGRYARIPRFWLDSRVLSLELLIFIAQIAPFYLLRLLVDISSSDRIDTVLEENKRITWGIGELEMEDNYCDFVSKKSVSPLLQICLSSVETNAVQRIFPEIV
jgi:hypothetical protein